MDILIFILIVHVSAIKAEDICSEYGGVRASNCTDGFPSLFRIDQVLGNTDLDNLDSRQVLIPGINFTCDGNITRWIFGAQWYGLSPAHLELQIWRRSSTAMTLYAKVDGTVITVSSRNSSGIYEYPLDTPLTFQEGDIFGYFQPIRNRSNVGLHLEDSGRITANYERLGINDIEPPLSETEFSLSSTSVDTRYPVVAVRTDPPGCGCGFMSVERVYALVESSGDRGYQEGFRGEELILFPSVMFMCSGQVVKWIVAIGRRRRLQEILLELQVWRLSQSTNNIYEKVGSTTIVSERQDDEIEGDSIYEFSVDSSVAVQPGDILGMYISSFIRIRTILYDEDSGAAFYYIREQMNTTIFDTNDVGVSSKFGLPLISVEIAPFRSSIPTPTSYLRQQYGTTRLLYSSDSTHTLSYSMTTLSVPTVSSAEDGSSSREQVFIIATVCCLAVLMIVAAVILISVLVLKKSLTKRKHVTKSDSVTYEPHRSSLAMKTNNVSGDSDYENTYVHVTHPNTNANAAYNIHEFSVSNAVFRRPAKENDIPTSRNDAYAVTVRPNKEANKEVVYDVVETNATMATDCVPNQAYGQILQQNDDNDDNEYI